MSARSLTHSGANVLTLTEEQLDAAEQAVRDAVTEAVIVTAVPAGAQTVCGIVLAVKSETSYYGYHAKTTVKALVQDDRGFKVWGTCPAKLADATENHTYDALRGQRVQFSAQLEVGDDFGFGFFSRPTKAALLGGVPA